jgi:hypothetical protein
MLTLNISDVGFFPDNNLVDEPGGVVVLGRGPEPASVGQLPLEFLEQEHEVPHSPTVTLHKKFKISMGSEGSVNGVG